jgi:hypothetical protein
VTISKVRRIDEEENKNNSSFREVKSKEMFASMYNLGA